jgi:hypothetical protein
MLDFSKLTVKAAGIWWDCDKPYHLHILPCHCFDEIKDRKFIEAFESKEKLKGMDYRPGLVEYPDIPLEDKTVEEVIKELCMFRFTLSDEDDTNLQRVDYDGTPIQYMLLGVPVRPKIVS